MDLLNELAPIDITQPCWRRCGPCSTSSRRSWCGKMLAENDFKITALTHKLAYYRRIRVGKASEALVGEQRMLFDETVDMDLADIEEELEAQAPENRLAATVRKLYTVPGSVSRQPLQNIGQFPEPSS